MDTFKDLHSAVLTLLEALEGWRLLLYLLLGIVKVYWLPNLKLNAKHKTRLNPSRHSKPSS